MGAKQRIGPYTIVTRLGRGGMAEVFLASHEPMPGAPRLVAIKRILANLADKPSFLQMFLDEARVLSKLYHPNLDRVLDAGDVNGVPYIVLDYLPGRDLGAVLRTHEARGLLPLDVSVHIAARIAAGLSHAHGLKDAHGRGLGIVHRDVSPENIIITFEGTVKLVDFGVARGTMRSLETAPGLIKGKPLFMAPEQILARPFDHRVDIFALGVLLYRLTVGQHPYGVQGNDASTFRRLLEVVPTPPHLLVRRYPRTLSAVVTKALERNPAKRHAKADDLLTDLEGVMREQGWFPSDRRLASLMEELFPEAADSARKLSVEAKDPLAAKQASYLTRGDLLAEDLEDLEQLKPEKQPRVVKLPDDHTFTPTGGMDLAADDLADTSLSDETCPAEDSVTKRIGELVPPLPPPLPLEDVGSTRGVSPSDLDTVTVPGTGGPSEMDSVTKPDGPTPQRQEKRPYEAKREVAVTEQTVSIRPRFSGKTSGEHPPLSPKASGSGRDAPGRARDLEESLLDSLPNPRSQSGEPTRGAKGPLDSRLGASSRDVKSPATPPNARRPTRSAGVERHPEEESSLSSAAKDSRLSDDTSISGPPTPRSSSRGKDGLSTHETVARGAPPPPSRDRSPRDSRLAGHDPHGDEPLSAEHTRPKIQPSLPDLDEPVSVANTVLGSRLKEQIEQDDEHAWDEASHPPGTRTRSPVPPWRTPLGMVLTVAIGTAVFGAIFLSLCGG